MIARFMPFLNGQRSKNSLQSVVFSLQWLKPVTLLTPIILFAICYLLFTSTAHAAPGINEQINFQGRLLNSDGTTVTDGSHSVVFSLYTVSTSGSNIWTETQSVTTTDGMFRVSLGSVSSLSSVNFNQDSLYLGIKVGSDSEMTPRLRFNAAPYAFMAETATNALSADTVDGLTFANGKTLTVNNSLTFTGTDSSSVNFGAGGTVCYDTDTCVQADSLDFDDFSDALNLDASTDISIGSGLTLSTGGAGNVAFNHTGLTSFAGDILLSGRASSSSTTEGTMYYDSDDDQLKVYANGKWQADRSIATAIVGTSNSTSPSADYQKADFVCANSGCETAIENAVNSLPADGGAVVLLEGVYVISSDGVDVTASNISLIGAGSSTILQRGYDATSYDGIITVGDNGTTPVSNVTIANLTISGAKTTYTGIENVGILFDNSVSYSQIRNINVQDTYGYGMFLEPDSDNNMVTENNFRGSSGVVFQAADNNSFVNNYSQSNANGVYLIASDNNVVANNHLESNSNFGVYLSSGSDHNSVTSNYIYSNGSSGIFITTASNNLISSNSLINNAGTGSVSSIRITTNSDNNTITTNYIADTIGTGFAIDIQTSDVNSSYVADNKLSGTGAASINDAGTNTVFANQVLNANEDIAIKTMGDVGIGTITPGAKLDVAGTLQASGAVTFSNYATDGGLLYTNTSGVVAQTATGSSGQCLQSAGGGSPTWGSCNAANTVTGTGTSGQLTFWNGTNTISSDAGLVWDNTNKRLGINTTPTADLEVDGTSILYNDSDGDGLLVGTSDDTASTYALSVTSGSGPYTIIYARADGRIGFGTNTPATQWSFLKNFSSSTNESGLTVAVNQDTASASLLTSGLVGATMSHTSGTQATVVAFNPSVILSGNGGTTTSSTGSLSLITVKNGAIATRTYNFEALGKFETGSTTGIAQGLHILPTIESGATVSSHTGIFIENAINSGSLTNQVGINIDNLTAATNNTLLLIGQSSTVSGNNAIYSGSTYQSTLSGPLYISASQNGMTQGESNQHIVLRSTNGNTGTGPGISFSSSTGTGNIGARIVFEDQGTNSIGDLVFFTKPDTDAGDTTVEALRITSTGAVKINNPGFDWALTASALSNSDGAAWFEYNYDVTTDNVGVLALRRQGSTIGRGGGIDFYMDDAGGVNSPYAYFGSYIVDNTAGSEDGGLAFGTTDGGATRQIKMRLDDEGRLAIGGVDNIDHTAQFEVFSTYNPLDDVGSSFNYTQILHNPNSTNGLSTGLAFSVTNTDHNIGAALIFVRTNGNSMGELRFYTKQTSGGGNDPSLAMTLDDAGFIHVNLDPGTATEAVCHSGSDASTTNVKLFDCSGNPAADYAEMYPVASGITYGDIVSIGNQTVITDDGQSIQQLVKSTTNYDSSVIGIVSDNYNDFSSTGYNVDKSDNPMPVALNGRVPVKIASHSTAIEPGDYITTSTQPGRAIRATEPGFMIGRALQAWDPVHQTDTIMVFVDNGYANPQAQVAGGVAVDPSSTSTITSQTVQDLTVQGSLSVAGPAEFNGPTIFKALSEFLYTVVFRHEVSFADHVAFSNDTVGTVKIAKGQDRAEVTFAKPYQAAPIINASLFDDKISASGLVEQIEADVCAYGDTLEDCQVKMQQNLLTNGARYLVTDVEPTGFTLLLDGPATQDYTFSWSAFAQTTATP